MMYATGKNNTSVFTKAGLPVLFAWALVCLAFFLPWLDSTQAPYFDLTHPWADGAYWLSWSGGKMGASLLALLMLILLVTRSGISVQRKVKEFTIITTVAVLCAGGGAALNEYFVKPYWQVPRPNIISLSAEQDNAALGMTPAEFYALGDKQVRSQYLARVLQQQPQAVPMTPLVASHWVAETGYSLPSGHSFAVMFFASFFVFIAASYLTAKRIILFYLLFPWALAVCYSRTLLRVHSPTDIVLGSLQGVIIGFLGWLLVKRLIRRFA